ncbi:fucolectin-1-like [Patella vulgata]|uniref:fucolectin-1-like n=1 Tax=Patella vulgata TaxID=6465 RepID=UPI0024A7ED59|nr:fucolectin-1-like [Patella vulgata]XP_055955887.1 fucolectin-1-like [Patella vulgata]
MGRNIVIPASKAVDGNKDGGINDSCIMTQNADFNPWWQVDLEWMYDITSVTISNRYDQTASDKLLVDVSVMVYDKDPFDSSDPSVVTAPSKLCTFLPGFFGRTVRTFECDQKTVGRYIRITKPTEYLSLCEVEVTGIQQ